ncbi:MAG: cysteine desulfurase-like protein [Rhodovibrionaceae bacterium]
MPYPLDEIRSRFPALALTDGGRPRIYLDNPAGTQVPQAVVEAVARCLVESNANLGGCFPTSRAADAVVEDAHTAMADFLGAESPEEIVIGANMTSLNFHLSRSLCRDFSPGDEILVTRMDHEGDVAPWLEIAADKGLEIRWLSFNRETWGLEPQELEAALTPRTRLVALNHASNLLGTVNDIAALTAVAKRAGALVAVDAVQSAPHRLIDVKEIGCDLLLCSSYKFFGPHLGIAWGRRALLEALHAYKCRCVGEELPVKFETGTPQIELLAGLTATVDYFAWLGEACGASGSRRKKIAAAYAAMDAHETGLTRQLLAGLKEISEIEVFGVTNPNEAARRVPTVSIRHARRKPAEIASALAEQGIFLWSGHNYALEVVRQLGIPEEEGVLRIGMAHYNTEEEIGRTLGALKAAVI